MKKVLALLIAIASMVTMLNCTPIYAEEAMTLTQDQLALLDYVGIYEENADLAETVTRAEFAMMLSKVAFGLDADLKSLATGTGAKDITKTSAYYYPVTALLTSGHISTNKFGNFLPEQPLDIDTAYEFILRTMGYAKVDLFVAGRYSKLAAQKDIADGLKSTTGAGVSRINAYILLYNMLNTDVADMLGTEYNISTNKEVLFRESRLELFKTSGIVTDDGSTALVGETAIDENQIIIANGKIMENKTGIGNLVGKYVVAYFTEDGDEDAVVLVYEREEKSETVVLEAENIIKFDTSKARINEYVYYDDEFSTKERKVKTNKTATVIYNDKALTVDDNFDVAKFMPETGVVRLYDNTGDGVMDIIRIEDYRAMVVEGKDAEAEFLYTNAGTEILKLGEKSYKIYDKDGNPVEIKNIPDDSILSIMESLDGKRIKILLSTDVQLGVVSSCVPSSGSVRGYITTEEGSKYSFSKYLDETLGSPEVSARYRFYLDVFGKVVSYERIAGPNDWRYGCVQWIKTDEVGEVIISLCNDSGAREIVSVANSLYVLGEDDSENTWSQGPIVTAIQKKEEWDAWNKANPNPAEGVTNPVDHSGINEDLWSFVTYKGLVRYKLNNSEKMAKIELPLYYGKRPTADNRLWCMLDVHSVEGEVPAYEGRKYTTSADTLWKKGSGYVIFGGDVALTSSADVFFVPKDVEEYDEYLTTTTDIFENNYNGNTSQTVMLFATEKEAIFADVAMLSSASGKASRIDQHQVMYLKSLRKTTDPKTEEICYELECITRTGALSKLLMEEEVYLNDVNAVSNGRIDGKTDAKIHLEPGDGFYYAVEDGYLADATVFYDASQMVYDTNVTKEQIAAGTAQKTMKGGIAGIETLTYENGVLSNPFATTANYETPADRYQGDHAPVADAHTLWPGGRTSKIKVFIGWVYDYKDGVARITNQNPAYGIDTSLDENDGVEWETIGITNTLTSSANIRSANVNITYGAAESIVRPYTRYGEACSKIIMTQIAYDVESTYIINPN